MCVCVCVCVCVWERETDSSGLHPALHCSRKCSSVLLLICALPLNTQQNRADNFTLPRLSTKPPGTLPCFCWLEKAWLTADRRPLFSFHRWGLKRAGCLRRWHLLLGEWSSFYDVVVFPKAASWPWNILNLHSVLKWMCCCCWCWCCWWCCGNLPSSSGLVFCLSSIHGSVWVLQAASPEKAFCELRAAQGGAGAVCVLRTCQPGVWNCSHTAVFSPVNSDT